jgi:hypothetical protein
MPPRQGLRAGAGNHIAPAASGTATTTNRPLQDAGQKTKLT